MPDADGADPSGRPVRGAATRAVDEALITVTTNPETMVPEAAPTESVLSDAVTFDAVVSVALVRLPARPVISRPAAAIAVDAAVGISVALVGPAVRAVRGLGGQVGGLAADPLRLGVALLAHPPLVPVAWAPGTLVGRFADLGRESRRTATAQVTKIARSTADLVVPLITEQVVSRLDLTDIVLDRVELRRIVGAVLDQLDLTEVVLHRVDLGAIVQEALDHLDLTTIVLDRVEFSRVISAALASVDLTEIVTTQVDLAGIADQVIDEVDLPGIIRESSSGVASDVIQGARMGAINADQTVSRLVDRLLLRRRVRRTRAPAEMPAETPADAAGNVHKARTGVQP
jgi:hypothetical protein